mmetsp:Transcript_13958/g.26751  ORF Transcript_13958/g.26751 Transcript_13958/m.26751 type:complete len:85 (-) Transcript_13958:188-442(-)
MATGFDRLLQRVPGSMPFKAFVAGMTLCTVMAYPVFAPSNEKTKQGHDYFSQERPEAVLQAEQASRKQYLKERQQRREEATQQS